MPPKKIRRPPGAKNKTTTTSTKATTTKATRSAKPTKTTTSKATVSKIKASAATTPATPRAQTSPNPAPEDDEDEDDEDAPAVTAPTPASTTRRRKQSDSEAMKPPPSAQMESRRRSGGRAGKKSEAEAEIEVEPTSFIERDVKKRGRPARTKAVEVIHEATETLLGHKPQSAETVEPPQSAESAQPAPQRKRGRGGPAATATAEPVEPEPEPTWFVERDVKKRGRPARAKAEKVIEEAAETLLQPETGEPVVQGERKRGRVRPGKSVQEEVEVQEPENEAPKKRGRPARKVELEPELEEENGKAEEEEVKEAPKKRGRGRPSSKPETDPVEAQEVVEEAPKKKGRGRPARKDAAEAEPEAETEEDAPELPRKRGRGRPAKADVVEPEVKEDAPAPAAPEPSKRRGRGRPAKTDDAEPEVEREAPETDAPEPPKKRGRGRPAKNDPSEPEVPDDDAPEPPKKHGRPSKADLATKFASKEDTATGSASRRSTRTSIIPPKAPEPSKPTRNSKKAADPAPATKSRGRKTAAAKEPEVEAEEETVESEAPTPAAARGRKRKAAAEPEEAAAPKRGRDRPKANADASAKEDTTPKKADVKSKTKAADAAPKKARGRPKAVIEQPAEDEAPATENPAPKKRGRPARKSEPALPEQEEKEVDHLPKHAHYHEVMDRVDDQIQEELATAAESPAPAKGKKTATKRKASAAPVAPSKPAKKSKKTTAVADEGQEGDAEIAADSGPDFWLMKAEPNTRIEKNADGEDVNVAFTIEDLRSRTEPEPWEGIRNGQAQNNLKAMKKGDLAFFYESNCKTPGIVGIMEIVQEASPDPAQFDRKSAYFDANGNTDKPRWMLVHVQFKRKFSEKISLKDLQKFSKPGGLLENMGLIKQSRLSVSKVSQAEWEFIMKQVEDEDEEEADVEAGAADGEMASEPVDGQDEAADENAEDLGNEFARAFDAPANFETAQEPTSRRSPVVEVPASHGQDNTNTCTDPEEAETDRGTTLTDEYASVFAAVPSVEDVTSSIPTLEGATDAVVNTSSGLFDTIGSAIGTFLGRSEDKSPSAPQKTSEAPVPIPTITKQVKETLEHAIESVEHMAENAAETIADAVRSIIPEPETLQQELEHVQDEAKKAPSRAASKVRSTVGSAKKTVGGAGASRATSRAPSVRASSRAPSRAPSVRARYGGVAASASEAGAGVLGSIGTGLEHAASGARSAARETIGSVESAFKLQSDTIFEGEDGEENEAAMSDLRGADVEVEGVFEDPTSGAHESALLSSAPAPVAEMTAGMDNAVEGDDLYVGELDDISGVEF